MSLYSLDVPSFSGTACALLLAVAACNPASSYNAAELARSPSQARASLASAGFTVQDGKFDVYQTGDCCAAGATCGGNNPSSTYLALWLPPAPGQTIANPEPSNGLSAAWYLRQDEAVVWIGTTPPAATYFSWDSYRFTKGLLRELLWDSLGDSLNNGVAWTSGTPNGSSGDPFNSLAVVVISPNATTAAQVKATLVASGYPASIINMYGMPSAQVTFGLNGFADTFNVAFRVALFDDPDAGAAWLADPGATLWRLTPATQLAAAPIPQAAPRAHATGVTEAALAPAVDRLEAAIRAKYASSGLQATALGQTLLDPNDPTCISTNQNCYADNRDTNYLGTSAFFLGSAQSFVMVYGVNHAAAGKAWYSNFAPYDDAKLEGLASIDSTQMPGSAEDYVPGDPDAASLYAWKIARSCNGEPHCMEISTTCPGGLGMLELGSVAFRTYVDPMTLAAPDPAELVADRAIHFGVD